VEGPRSRCCRCAADPAALCRPLSPGATSRWRNWKGLPGGSFDCFKGLRVSSRRAALAPAGAALVVRGRKRTVLGLAEFPAPVCAQRLGHPTTHSHSPFPLSLALRRRVLSCCKRSRPALAGVAVQLFEGRRGKLPTVSPRWRLRQRVRPSGLDRRLVQDARRRPPQRSALRLSGATRERREVKIVDCWSAGRAPRGAARSIVRIGFGCWAVSCAKAPVSCGAPPEAKSRENGWHGT